MNQRTAKADRTLVAELLRARSVANIMPSFFRQQITKQLVNPCLTGCSGKETEDREQGYCGTSVGGEEQSSNHVYRPDEAKSFSVGAQRSRIPRQAILPPYHQA